MKEIENLNYRPFTRWCMSIGAVPSSYLAGMGIEEQLLWLCSYLEKEVIPAVNNNGEAVTELQNLFLELQDYVDHYFENLDVTEEINNKLDELVEDGTLENLIGAYIQPRIDAQNQVISQLNTNFTNFQSEVNGDLQDISNDMSTLTSNVNTQISNINSAVTSLASGSPLVASSVAGMTDTTKTYVNTSNGYWYYYNGTQWVQGGVYQASQSNFGTQQNTDFLNTNNYKHLINWQVGNLNASGITTSQYMIVTTNINKFDEDLYIEFSSKIKYTVWFYDDTTGTNPSNKGNMAGNDNKAYMIPKNQCFRLVVDYTNSSDPDRVIITDAYNSVLFNNIEIYDYEYYKFKSLKNSTNYITNILEKPINDTLLITGDINMAGVNINASANNRRLVSWYILNYDYDILMPQHGTTENTYLLYTYDNANGTNPVNKGWLNRNYPYIIKKGTYFRILAAANDTNDTTKVGKVFDSSLYKKLNLSKFEKLENKNFNAIAHQGYSITNYVQANGTETNYIGNCRLSSCIGAKMGGFDTMEIDLQWTSDGIPVCCHDASFTSDGQTIVISDNTFAQLLEFDYYGETIASFDQIVEKCKELGLKIYIDHIASTLTNTQYNTIFNILKKYEMIDKAKFLVNSKAIAQTVLSYYNKAKIALVTEANDLSSIIADANSIKTDLNEISIDFKWTNVSQANLLTYKNLLNKDIKLECWTLDNIEQYKTALKYCDGITSNRLSYSMLYK